MHNVNAGGNGRNITAGTNTTAAVTLPSLPPEGTPTACDGTYINGGWYTGPVLMFSSSQPDAMPARHWCSHHHSRMVHRSGVDVLVITVGWYVGLALICSSSPSVGTLLRR